MNLIGLPALTVTFALAATSVLSGCGSSPPTRYHALSPAAPPQAAGSARLLVEILPIAVPERLNREEMVLTGEGGRLDVRDGDHWAAPLADEIRQILTDSLWRRLRAADSYQAPVAPSEDGPPQIRLALRIERFEAVPGRSALVEESWTMRLLPHGRSVSCRTGMTVPLPERTPEAAAVALSEATGQLAGQLADSIGQLERDGASVCPSDAAG